MRTRNALNFKGVSKKTRYFRAYLCTRTKYTCVFTANLTIFDELGTTTMGPSTSKTFLGDGFRRNTRATSRANNEIDVGCIALVKRTVCLLSVSRERERTRSYVRRTRGSYVRLIAISAAIGGAEKRSLHERWCWCWCRRPSRSTRRTVSRIITRAHDDKPSVSERPGEFAGRTHRADDDVKREHNELIFFF